MNNSRTKDLREAEKASAQAEANRLAFVKVIMSTLGGRAWMHTLLDRCCMFHSPMVVGFPDATGFNIGKQDIGRQIFADVSNTCPHEYTLMMQEASTKELAHERRIEPNDANRTDTEDSGRNLDRSGFDIDTSGFVIHDDSPGEDGTGAEAASFN